MKSLLICLSLLLTSCASYQAGEESVSIGKEKISGLEVSAQKDYDLSSKYYTMVNFYFGSSNDKWQRIKKVRVKLPKKTSKEIKVVLGKDLTDWAESIKYVKQVDSWNQSMLLGSIALAGAAVSTSSHSQTARGGAIVALSSLSVMEGNRVFDKYSELQRSQLVPESHLYREASIPAGLHMKKWILLEVEDNELPKFLEFEVTMKDKRKATYKVDIRPFDQLN